MRNPVRRMLFTTALLVIVTAGLLLSCKQTEQPSNPTLRIIGLFPMTGPGASLGEYLRNGAQLGKEEADREFNGKLSVEIETVDSKNQPREGISALESALATKRPNALIAGLSSVSKAVIPVVEQEGLLTVVTTTALTDLTKGTKNVVRVYPTSEDFVEPIAEYMVRRFDRVAVLYINDDFGQRNQDVFRTIVQSAGKKVVAAESFEPTQSDSRTVIARMVSASPQAVFVTGYGPAFVAIFKQLRESGSNLPTFTEIGFANPAILSGLGADADGVIFDGTEMELANSADAGVAAFQAEYKKRFGTDPYQVAGFARDAVVLLAHAAMKSGSFVKPDKAIIISLSPFQGSMGPIRFDAEGESRISLRLMKRENGRTVLIQ